MQVETTRPLKVVPLGGEAVIVNRGSPTLSYKNTGSQDQGEAVSASNRDGTLAQNSSLTITAPTWFISTTVKGEVDVRSANGALEIRGAGEEQTVYTPNPNAQQLALNKGSTASPDETYGPLLHVSRDISIAESTFSGAGEPGLSAGYFVTKAAPTSEGQAIGLTGGAITASTHEGSHSLADGIGVCAIGKATSVSTRTGMGLFANGRREATGARAVGAEITADNETVETPAYSTSGLPTVMGIHCHATGTANGVSGVHFGIPGTASWQYGITAEKGAVTLAVLRDDSEAERSILIKGAHAEAAIAIASGANGISVGAEKLATAGPFVQIADATAPSGNPATGGLLYCNAGALFYRSSAGKVTELAKV